MKRGFWKDLNFIWKYFPIQKMYATQWFSWEKIKWLLQNISNMSWEFKRIKFKVLLKIIFNLELFGFLFKLFFSKNKIYGKYGNIIPYSRKFERNKFEIILMFLKWFLWGFIAAVALFALFEFLGILFDVTKMFLL